MAIIIFNDLLIMSVSKGKMEEKETKASTVSTVSSSENLLLTLHSSVNGHICHCHFLCHSESVKKSEHESVLRRCTVPSATCRRPLEHVQLRKSLLSECILSPNASANHVSTSDTSTTCSNACHNSSLFCAFVILCICCSLVHCAFTTAHNAFPSSSSSSSQLPFLSNYTDHYSALLQQIRFSHLNSSIKNVTSFSGAFNAHVTQHLEEKTFNDSLTSKANVSSLKLKRSNDANEVNGNVPPSTHPLSAVNVEDDEEEEEEEEDEEENADNESSGKSRQFKTENDHSNGEQKSGNFENHSQTGGSDNVDYVMHSPRTVNTKYGALQGIVITFVRYEKSTEKPIPPPSTSMALSPVEAFLGVPYATPPSGNLRFMPPVAPVHWRGVRQANHLSPVCPQPLPKLSPVSNESRSGREGSDKTEQLNRNMSQQYFERLTRKLPYLRNQSEDCLTLNIYVPFEQYYQQRHTFRAHQKSSHSRTNKNRNKLGK